MSPRLKVKNFSTPFDDDKTLMVTINDGVLPINQMLLRHISSLPSRAMERPGITENTK